MANNFGFVPTPTPASNNSFGFKPSSPSVQPAQTQSSPNPLDGFSILDWAGSKIGNAFKSGINQVKEGFQQGRQSTNPIQALESGAKMAAGGINAISAPLAPVFAPIEAGVNMVADKISNVPAVQKFAQSSAGQTTSRVAEDAGNLATIAGGVAGAEGGKALSPEIADSVKTGVSGIAEDAKTSLQNKYVSSTANDWNRIGGDYVKTDKLLSAEEAKLSNPNNPTSVQDTPTFLAQHGITPQSLIKDGKFDTAEVATKITSEALKPFEHILNEQLKVVQQGQPPVPVEEIRNSVIRSIDSIKGETPDSIESMKSIAENKISALERKYPNGVPLVELNIQKGNFWKGTKFDITKPLDPQINYQIGSAMKTIIENHAGDASVTELNGVLGNYYKAGKFLNGLNDRIPKLTTGQKISRGIIKAGTTAVGEKMFGLSGGVGGYLLGKSVSAILENASNPLKTFILNGLEKTNPEAYTKAIQWLGEQEANRIKRLALPSPNVGTGTVTPNVIATPAPTTFEAPAQNINRE